MKFLKRTISILLIIYLSLIFFNGIYTKILFPLGLISFKKILPELTGGVLSLIILITCIKERKFKKNIYLFSLIFFTLMFLFQMFSIDDGNFFKAIRDNLMPFILLYLIQCYQFDIEEKSFFVKYLEVFMTVFIFSGAALGIIQSILGSEWSSQFYTGYNFYERDSTTGVMIWHLGEYLRVPSVTGDSVIFAMCNLFAFFFLDLIRSQKYLKYLALLNIILSTSRTILIVYLIYLSLSRIHYLYINKKFHFKLYIDNKCNLSKEKIQLIKERKNIFIVGAITIFILFVLSIIFLLIKDFPSVSSLYERINSVWLKVFQNISLQEFLIGKGVFEVGSGMKLSLAANTDYNYIFSFVDNTYIYMLLCYGIVGLGFYIALNIELVKQSVNYNNITYLCFIIASLIGALTINYMQGRCYIFLFVIYTLFIVQNHDEKGEERHVKYS